MMMMMRVLCRLSGRQPLSLWYLKSPTLSNPATSDRSAWRQCYPACLSDLLCAAAPSHISGYHASTTWTMLYRPVCVQAYWLNNRRHYCPIVHCSQHAHWKPICSCLCLDFFKAFDTICHSTLMDKMSNLSYLFLQRSSLFYASGLDNPFPVRCKKTQEISLTKLTYSSFCSQILMPWQPRSISLSL